MRSAYPKTQRQHFPRTVQIQTCNQTLKMFFWIKVFFMHLQLSFKLSYFVLIIRPEKTQDVDAAKDTTIKPAKLSRGRAPKPLLPLGRKWGKKAPPPSTKAKDDVSDKGDESVSDGASKEQVIISVSSSDLSTHCYFPLLKVIISFIGK